MAYFIWRCKRCEKEFRFSDAVRHEEQEGHICEQVEVMDSGKRNPTGVELNSGENHD